MIDTNQTIEKEAEAFAAAITSLEAGSPLYSKLYLHFSEEMRKAVDHGCICTPERMAKLYPIFREINMEQEDSQKYWEDWERKDRQRRERRNAKEGIYA